MININYLFFFKLFIILNLLNSFFFLLNNKNLKCSINQPSLNSQINNNITNKPNDHTTIRFIITIVPIHNNYGDEAIFLSTKQFLKDYFPNIQQIIINGKETLVNLKLIKYIINDKDIIIISGGGYFGLYDHIIKEQANIVQNFPKNEIIFFPCSIAYNKTNQLNYIHYLEIFNNHPNLIFFIRERISFNISKQLFYKSSLYLVPDIATRLNIKNFKLNSNKRSGILLILRKDELLLEEKDHLYIKKIAQKYFNEVIQLDSNKFIINKGSNKSNETINFIKLIKSKQLVITDRLHGMILSIITETPNIVFGNNYHKVESSYNSWFNKVSYCFFIKKKEIKYKLESTILSIITL